MGGRRCAGPHRGVSWNAGVFRRTITTTSSLSCPGRLASAISRTSARPVAGVRARREPSTGACHARRRLHVSERDVRERRDRQRRKQQHQRCCRRRRAGSGWLDRIEPGDRMPLIPRTCSRHTPTSQLTSGCPGSRSVRGVEFVCARQREQPARARWHVLPRSGLAPDTRS